MSNFVGAVRLSCSCGTNTGIDPQNMTTVPAGSVGNGISACGYDMELTSLPQTVIRPQNYREGFCPDEALGIGTLFPELEHTYK